jgi:hypothetical protein
VRTTLEQRGIREDMLRLEHAGIPAVLAEHGLTWESLGLRGATLYYRRRIEDMPLIETPSDADAARAQKFEATRRKILEKAMQKYSFQTKPLLVPVGMDVEGNRLVGLRFQQTRVESGKVVPVDGKFEDVRAPLVVSSIGSIPEPVNGIGVRGELYDYSDREVGRVRGYDNVFSTGNVVTGKGNIVASRKHSIEVTSHLIERYLGLGDGHDGEEALFAESASNARAAAGKLAEVATTPTPLPADRIETILRRVAERQKAVGYAGSYRDWIAKVTPPDLA